MKNEYSVLTTGTNVQQARPAIIKAVRSVSAIYKGGLPGVALFVLSLLLAIQPTQAQIIHPCFSSASCSANDFQLSEVFLASDLAGTPLTTDDCNLPLPRTAYYVVRIQNNTSSQRIGIYVDARVKTGATISNLTYCFDTIMPQNTIVQLVVPTPVFWDCQSPISITESLLLWSTASGNVCPGNVLDCGPTSPSKCRGGGSLPVGTPLVSNFTYTAACVPNVAVQQVTYTDSSFGGDYPNVTYLWDFGAGATPATANTKGPHTISYSTSGTKTVTLTVFNQNGTNDTRTKSVQVGTCCVFSATCPPAPFTANLSCEQPVPSPATTKAQLQALGFNIVSCGPLGITSADVRTNGNCPNNYSIARTYTVFDDRDSNGIKGVNELGTTCVQTINVSDTTKPQFVGQLPANVTVNCNAVPTAPTITATDNCGVARVTYSEQRTNGNCLNNYTLTRTWTAKDTCNNTLSHVQIITVQDTTKPQFVGQLPANVTVNCDAVPAAATITATDNCGAASVSYNEQRTNGNCLNNYTLTRTWTAKDTCNNTLSHVQIITVQDTTKPQFVGQLPGNITVNCNAVPAAATLTATDNCGSASVSYSEQRTNGNCLNNYTLTRTWTAKDTCNNTLSHVQIITVQDTTKPQFVGQLPGNITVNCDAIPAAATLTATDNCGSASVSYSEQRTNGNCLNNYTLTRTWTAKDTCNNTLSHVQIVTVQDTTKPQFVGQLPGNITVNCDAIPAAATLSATDNCGSASVSYSEQRTNGNCLNNYTLTRTWTAKDTCNNTTTHVQIVTVQDTTKPQFVGQLPGAITVNCDAVPAADVLRATDNCGSASVSYSEQRTNGNCLNNYTLTRTWVAKDTCNNTTTHVQIVTVQDTTKPQFVGQLPGNITVNCNAVPTAPTITATDNCGSASVSYSEQRTNGNCLNNYTLTRTWTAKDTCNNTLTHVQIVTVQDTTKPQFVGQLPGNITVNCNAVPTAPTITATDNCGSASVSYSEQRTNGNCLNNYTLTRTWTAKDTCNNILTHVQIVTVQDTTKPQFVGQLPASVTVNCDAIPTAPVLTATDNCGQATVSYSEQRSNGNCPSYTLTRTWTAKDTCNNTTTHVQIVTVQDTTKPQFKETLPADITVNCDAVPAAVTLTTNDNCGAAPVDFREVRTNGNCLNNYTLTRTWTAEDACQNRIVHVQIVTVQDTTKPQFVGQLPGAVTVNCDAVPAAATLTATDNCGAATVSYSEQRTNGNCLNNYTLTRTWIAKDTCNNTTTHVQIVTVQDTTKPQFVGQLPGAITVNCDAVPAADVLRATDNCGSASVSYSEQRTNGNCLNNYTLTRTWVAKDTCNNTTTHVQIVTVQDTTKPQFVGQLPGAVTVNCDAVPAAAVLTATDNCGAASVSYSEQRTNGNCLNNYTLTRTWVAKDTCNNTTTHVQIVTVQDTTKPQFVGQLPGAVTVNCDAVPAAAVLTATDNCGAASVSYSEQRTDGNCPNNYTLTRTWVAKDTCNNTTTHVQIVTVQDTTKPQFVGQLPGAVTVNCDAVPAAAVLTATDNCGAASVSYSEQRTNGNCLNNYTLTRTWTAKDTCNNTTTHVQIVTVQDTTKPQFVGNLPGNITVNCDAIPTAPVLTATDNCGSATVSYSEQRSNGNCPSYTLTRTWIAKDTCNNTTTHVQIVTVQDTTKPEFIEALPSDTTVNCDAIPAAVTLTTSDNCGAAPVDYREVRIDGNCLNNYTLTRTWTAEDACQNRIVHVQIVTVQDTTKPQFVGNLPGAVTVNCDAVPAADVLRATDNCGSASVSYSEQRTDGNCLNNYMLTRTWIAKDICNNTTTHVQIVTVQDTTKPQFVGQLPGAITVNCDAVPAADVLRATDNCGSASVSYSEQRTDGNCLNNYTLTRTWIAKDTCNNTTTHVQIVTVQDTTKPQFVGNLPGAITVNCDAVPTADVLTATDNCGSASVSYSEQRTDGNCLNNYTLTRTWVAKDTCNNTTTHVQIVTVQDTTKPQFVGQLPGAITVNCDAVPAADVLTATDNCGSASVSYSEQRTDGNCLNNYKLTRTWVAKDTCNNTTTHVQIVTVQDTTKPQFVGQLPGAITVNCDAVPAADVLTATDNCGAASVSYSEQRTDGNCLNNYTLTRTWIAKDTCNNTTTHVQIVTVQDTTKPQFVGQLPGNITVNCDAVPAADVLTATDNCGPAMIYYYEQRTNGNCENNYTLTRTWWAYDTCRNVTTHVQIVTVQDTTKPQFVGQLPGDITVNCDAVPAAAVLTATDNCGAASVSYNEQRTDGNCLNNYTLTRTWVAKDTCNNRTTHVQIVTVQDTTKPQFVGQLPGAITVNCDAVPAADVLTATDNCGSASVSYSEQRTDGNCPNNYTLTRTWIAKDTCNNTTTHVQIVTVQDTTKPKFNGRLPEDITVDCDAVPAAAVLTAEDNCSVATVSFSEQRTDGNCPNNYTLTRTWVAKDTCNNTITHIQIVTVQDTTKPVIDGTPADLTVSCASDVPGASIQSVRASDNCAGDVTVTVNDVISNRECANRYTVTRTWTATDVCGNSSSTSQTITVNDQTPPVFDQPLPGNVETCSNVPNAPILTATDNCGSATVTYTETVVVNPQDGSTTYTRVWTATDVCGNATTHTQLITVNPEKEVTIDRTICEGQSVTVGSHTYTYTGNYTETLVSAEGCDSIVHLNLTVLPVLRTEVDAVICPGDQVVVGGQIFTTSVSDYIITLPAANGCDSIITLNLVVLDQDTIETSQAICRGDFVDIGGHVFTDAGTYYISFQNDQCTGIVKLVLTVNEPTTSVLTQTICAGETAVVAGQVFSEAGNYIVVTSNAAGCDSTIKFTLNVIPAAETTINEILCYGQTITIGNETFNTTGTYEVVLKSPTGCDSIINLNLVVLNSGDTSSISQTICEGDSVIVAGQVFTDAGTFYINANEPGCSAVIELTVAVNQPTEQTIKTSICEGEVIIVGGQTFTQSGNYTIITQNAAGCDSIITLVLDVSQGGSKTQIDSTICEGASVTVAGQTFFQTGTYQVIYPSGHCRDTFLLNLIVNPVKETTQRPEICEGERFVVGNNVYTETGTYTDVLSTAKGCDSTVTTILTVHPLPQASFNILGGGILCQGDSISLQLITEPGNSVEWYLNDTLIVGAAGTTIPIFVSGQYSVVVTSQFGCVTEADSFIVVNFNPNSSLNTVSDSTLCDGDIVLLTADPGYADYQWFNNGVPIPGANGNTIQVESTGSYSVLIENTAGCQQITREQNLRFDPIPVAKIIADNEVLCERDDTLQLSSEFPHAVYQWYYNGVLIQGASGRTLDVTQEGQYILIVSDSTCIGSDTFNIASTICSQPPTANDDCVEEMQKNTDLVIDVLANDTDPDQDELTIEAIIEQPKYGTAIIDQIDQTITYTPNRNFCGRDTLVYVMCDSRDGCDTATVCIKVNCVCEYPQVITPNGDGLNDNLFFPCISQVEGARLLVWHRWGLIVYEDDNYKNNWNGTLKGEILPAGTYWYSIEFKDPESGEPVKEVNYFMIIN